MAFSFYQWYKATQYLSTIAFIIFIQLRKLDISLQVSNCRADIYGCKVPYTRGVDDPECSAAVQVAYTKCSPIHISHANVYSWALAIVGENVTGNY